MARRSKIELDKSGFVESLFTVNENMGIYILINYERKICYIGKSKSIRERKQQHFSRLRNGKHENQKLQDIYFQYTRNSKKVENFFEFRVLVNCPYLVLSKLEVIYFEIFHQCGYIVFGSNRTEIKSRYLSPSEEEKLFLGISKRNLMLYINYYKIISDGNIIHFGKELNKLMEDGVKKLQVVDTSLEEFCKDLISNADDAFCNYPFNYIAYNILNKIITNRVFSGSSFLKILCYGELYSEYSFEMEFLREGGYINKVIREIKRDNEFNNDLIRFVAIFFSKIKLYEEAEVWDLEFEIQFIKEIDKEFKKIKNVSDLLYVYILYLYCLGLIDKYDLIYLN